MNAANEHHADPGANPSFDKFADPRTFPGGWDLTSLEPRRNGESALPEENPFGNPEIGEGADTSKPGSAWERDQFPRPSTIPAGWDTSALK